MVTKAEEYEKEFGLEMVLPTPRLKAKTPTEISPRKAVKLKSHLTGTHYQRGRSIGVTPKS